MNRRKTKPSARIGLVEKNSHQEPPNNNKNNAMRSISYVYACTARRKINLSLLIKSHMYRVYVYLNHKKN